MTNRLTGEELNRRLNTIALNAVREAQIAMGRGEQQWCDDDFQRQQIIADTLKLHDIGLEDRAAEHYPLVSIVQAPKNPKLETVAKVLADQIDIADIGEPKTKRITA